MSGLGPQSPLGALAGAPIWLCGPLLGLEETQRAAAWGAGLAGLNAVAAYALVRGSQGQKPGSFVAMVLGGMLARMAVLLALVVLLVLRLGVAAEPLVASLLIYYVLFLAIELWLVQRERGMRSETR